MKKYSYMIAGFDFTLVFVNIYLGFARNNPLSFLAAGICLIAGISAMMN